MNIVADENIPFVKKCFESLGSVTTLAGNEITPETLAQADILLVRSVTKVNQQLLHDSPVKFVATATIGTDHIDLDYLRSRNIGFAAAPGSNANSVAEYVTAAMLKLAQRDNYRLAEKSVGIIGVGNVGSNVTAKLSGLGMTTILNDPPLQRKSNDPNYRPLAELFDADFITLHTPLTRQGPDKTFHLADADFFNSLKPGCTFINTSRGAVAETDALKKAIADGCLAAAVLDVWEDEPDIDIELLKMTDIATPHIAGYSFDGKVIGMIMIYKAVCKHFAVEPTHTAADFLPVPRVKQIQIKNESAPPQQLLHQAVKQVYDITADDARMRKIIDEPADGRGKYFTALRKNYPQRREFQNTEIILDDINSELALKFKATGFKVNQK